MKTLIDNEKLKFSRIIRAFIERQRKRGEKERAYQYEKSAEMVVDSGVIEEKEEEWKLGFCDEHNNIHGDSGVIGDRTHWTDGER